MRPTKSTPKVFCADSFFALMELPANSVDAVVTDPPYGLTQKKKGGSGVKSIDPDSPHGRARIGSGNGNGPGGFMGMKWDSQVPDFGFWLQVIRVLKPGGHLLAFAGTRTYHRMVVAIEDAGLEIRDQIQWIYGSGFPKSLNCGEGRGTALKPANEPIVLARKPLSEKTVAKNIEKWGTGAINVDVSRVAASDQAEFAKNWDRETISDMRGGNYKNSKPGKMQMKQVAPIQGRFPANVIFDEVAAEMLDGQTGSLGKSAGGRTVKRSGKYRGGKISAPGQWTNEDPGFGDSGGASRFFYCAKASKSERGVENKHPTVKPLKLMRYLISLVTPKGGIVLDPFMGSGTTGVAAKSLGVRFIGIEKERPYFQIAKRRIRAA